MGAFVNAILGAGMQAWGLQQQMHQQKWLEDFQINQLNNQRQAQETGFGMWQNAFDPARDTALGGRDTFANLLLGNDGTAAQLSELIRQYPGLLDQLLGSGADPFARGMNPGMQEGMSQVNEALPGFLGGSDLWGQVAAGGGWTPGRADYQARFMDMLNGQGSEMANLSDVGGSLLGSRGNSAFTQGYKDRGMDAVNAGGMNAYLSDLMNGGSSLFANQGFNSQNSNLFDKGMSALDDSYLGTSGLTPTGAMAELSGLNTLDQGGETGTSGALSSRGLDLANRESLLPPELAMLFARETAARDSQGAFRQAQRQALARKGGAAGVVAAGGGEHDPMSEYADLAARQVSDAGRKALVDQQGLQLTQAQMGANMAGQGGSLANNRYSAAGDLVKGLENNATQRYLGNAGVAQGALQNALGYAGLGSNTVLGGQGAATNNASTLGGLGMQAGNLENSWANTGLNSLQAYNQNRLGAGQLMNSGLQGQENYALGAGGLQNSFLGNYMNGQNQQFQNNLAAGQFGFGQNQAQLNGWNQGFNNLLGYNRDNSTNLQSFLSNLTNLGGQGLTYATAGMGQVAPPQYINTAPTFSGIAQGLSNVQWPGSGGKSGGGSIQQPFGQTWTPPPFGN